MIETNSVPRLLHEANTARNLAEKDKPSFVEVACATGAYCCVLVTAAIATIAKIILWNPVEWLIRGKVKTQSPWKSVGRCQKILFTSKHMIRYQRICDKLFYRSEINKEVVEAFKILSPHAECLNLSCVNLVGTLDELKPIWKKLTPDWQELTSMAKKNNRSFTPDVELAKKISSFELPEEGRIFSAETLNRCVLTANASLTMVIGTLNATSQYPKPDKGTELNKSIQDSFQLYLKQATIRNQIRIHTAIELINIASASPTCTTIKIPKALAQFKEVTEALSNTLFQLDREEVFDIQVYKFEPF